MDRFIDILAFIEKYLMLFKIKQRKMFINYCMKIFTSVSKQFSFIKQKNRKKYDQFIKMLTAINNVHFL